MLQIPLQTDRCLVALLSGLCEQLHHQRRPEAGTFDVGSSHDASANLALQARLHSGGSTAAARTLWMRFVCCRNDVRHDETLYGTMALLMTQYLRPIDAVRRSGFSYRQIYAETISNPDPESNTFTPFAKPLRSVTSRS